MAGQQPAPSPGSGDVQGVPIKVTGALAGVVFVADLAGPVASLRSEIARLLGGWMAHGVGPAWLGSVLGQGQRLMLLSSNAAGRLGTLGGPAGPVRATDFRAQHCSRGSSSSTQ